MEYSGIITKDGYHIARVYARSAPTHTPYSVKDQKKTLPPSIEAKANAAFIVRAVNEYEESNRLNEELLKALRDIYAAYLDSRPTGEAKKRDELFVIRNAEKAIDASYSAISARARRGKMIKTVRSEMLGALRDNLAAWEGEEDSVKDEHRDLIARLKVVISKAEGK